MSKRIHELAREWNKEPKDVIAAAERIGVRGKRSQSSLTDEEAQRIHEALGLTARPAVVLGSERVVSERVVTESNADQVVTAREQTTETRLRANVIRRRTAREVLKREEIPTPAPSAPADHFPPALDEDIPPPLAEIPPPVAAEPVHQPEPEPEPVEPAPVVAAPPPAAEPV